MRAVVLILCVVLLGVGWADPAAAQVGVTVPLNVDKVDGFDASISPVPGSLLALDGAGRFPLSTLASCGTGQILKFGATGWGCASDDGGTLYTAGAGLILNGSQFAADLSSAGGENGTAGTIARSDHSHDTRYVPRGDLGALGTINSAGNPVSWTKLKAVPSGIADGVDDIDGGNAANLTCTGCVAAAELAFDPATQAELDTLAAAGIINTATNPVDWTKLKGVPDALADGIDSDTTYAAGPGLVLSGNTFSIGGVTSSMITDGTITGADVSSATTLTTESYRYATPKAGKIFADPTSCQRARPSFPFQNPYVDVGTAHPPANSIGPSIAITNPADGTYDFYCAVPLAVPVDGSLTITGANLVYFDYGTTCTIGAAIRKKTIGTIGFSTPLSTQFAGSSASDFAFISAPTTKAFPAFSVTPGQNDLLFVTMYIQNQGGGGDCRYSGVHFTYTVTAP